MTPAQLNGILDNVLAAWVGGLGIRVTCADAVGGILAVLPASEAVALSGATVCGQAIAAAADTAAIAAICHARGGWVPMATIGQYLSFERPIPVGSTALLRAEVDTITARHAFVRVRVEAGNGAQAAAAHLVFALRETRSDNAEARRGAG